MMDGKMMGSGSVTPGLRAITLASAQWVAGMTLRCRGIDAEKRPGLTKGALPSYSKWSHRFSQEHTRGLIDAQSEKQFVRVRWDWLRHRHRIARGTRSCRHMSPGDEVGGGFCDVG